MASQMQMTTEGPSIGFLLDLPARVDSIRILVTAVLVIVAIVLILQAIQLTCTLVKRNSNQPAAPSAIIIQPTEKDSNKNEEKKKAEKEKCKHRDQYLPSKSIKLELNIEEGKICEDTEKKDKEKKAKENDILSVVEMQMDAPPAYDSSKTMVLKPGYSSVADNSSKNKTESKGEDPTKLSTASQITSTLMDTAQATAKSVGDMVSNLIAPTPTNTAVEKPVSTQPTSNATTAKQTTEPKPATTPQAPVSPKTAAGTSPAVKTARMADELSARSDRKSKTASPKKK